MWSVVGGWESPPPELEDSEMSRVERGAGVS